MPKQAKDESIEILKSQSSLYERINSKMRDMATRNQRQLANLMMGSRDYLSYRVRELADNSQEIKINDEINRDDANEGQSVPGDTCGTNGTGKGKPTAKGKNTD